MDKSAIVIGNYIDVDCDANTTPRQAYERGFHRAAKKCETVMHTRKIENVRLRELCGEYKAENAKLRELCGNLFDRLMDKDEHCGECRSQCEHDAWNFGDPKCVYAKRVRELGVEAPDV